MTELTCLLCFSFFLRFRSSCLCLICLASSMLYRDALSMYRPGCWCWCGTSSVPASRVRKPRGCYCPRTCDAKSSRGLVCIFLFPSRCLPLSLSRSHLFTTHCILLVCQSSCVHVVPINPQDLLLGRPMFHTQTHAQTRALTTVFPPSRICSIFPQESGGTRPISLILPVSSCLALKMCV